MAKPVPRLHHYAHLVRTSSNSRTIEALLLAAELDPEISAADYDALLVASSKEHGPGRPPPWTLN